MIVWFKKMHHLMNSLKQFGLKNEELARLNKDLIQKDSTIFNLRGKISELNNVLSLSEDKQKQQLEKLELLQNQIALLEQENQTQKETSLEEIKNNGKTSIKNIRTGRNSI